MNTLLQTLLRPAAGALLVATGLSTSTLTAAHSVVNGSFETFTGVLGADGGAQLLPGSSLLPGWTIVGGEIGILFNTNIYGAATPTGDHFMELAGYTNTGFPKGLAQTLTGLVTGLAYEVSLELGILNGVCNGTFGCDGPIQVSAQVDGVGPTFTHNSSAPGNAWGRYAMTFVAAGPEANLLIQGVSMPVGNFYIGVDNVAIAAVPEPANWALMIAGLAGMLARRRLRR